MVVLTEDEGVDLQRAAAEPGTKALGAGGLQLAASERHLDTAEPEPVGDLEDVTVACDGRIHQGSSHGAFLSDTGVELGPPVGALERPILLDDSLEAGRRTCPGRISLCRGLEGARQHRSGEVDVEHLVRPIEVEKQRRERITGGAGERVLLRLARMLEVPLAALPHHRVLGAVEQGVALAWLELEVRVGGEGELVRDRVPVDVARLERDLAEHRVSCLVPQVAREIAMVLEAPAWPLEERQGEKLDDVHLRQPHVEQAPVHLGGRGIEAGKASTRVPEPREALVAARRPDELERLDRSGGRQLGAAVAVPRRHRPQHEETR